MGHRCKCCDDIYSNHKNFIRGGVDESDFEDDFRHSHPKRKTKKSRPRSETRQPCPEAEDGKHVYVLVGYEPEYNYSYDNDRIFLEHFGYHKHEILRCCGCNIAKGYRRKSERYMKVKERKWRTLTGGEFAVKRGEPVGRYSRYGRGFWSFSWEDEDAEYMAKAKANERVRQEHLALMRKRSNSSVSWTI